MTVICYLAKGKYIPPHFVVQETLLNIFGEGGCGETRLLLVKNIQYLSEHLIYNSYIII